MAKRGLLWSIKERNSESEEREASLSEEERDHLATLPGLVLADCSEMEEKGEEKREEKEEKEEREKEERKKNKEEEKNDEEEKEEEGIDSEEDRLMLEARNRCIRYLCMQHKPIF